MSEPRRPLPGEPFDTPPEDLESAVAPTASERLLKIMLTVLVAVGIVAVLAIGFSLSAKHSADQANSAKSTANSQAKQLYSQAASAGVTPVATPSGVSSAPVTPGPSGPTGATGAQGATGAAPSAAQIKAAVGAYCAVHANCTGVPSRTQVQAAVAAYCATGVCAGSTGQTGASGSAGASGTPGASVSNSDIAAAIGAYCDAHNNCTGPAGPSGAVGPTGPAGQDGRGIASIDCSGLGIDSLTVVYSDGTSATIPCGGAAPTTATETP